MKLIFATNNLNKLREVQKIIGEDFEISTPADYGITEDIPETQETLEGNALEKARYIYKRTKINCFTDDTGLEVEVLNNAPGVYSARYAGIEKDNEANISLLLKNMAETTNRKAQFRTAIALILGGKEFLFEGIVRGKILTEKKGDKGFGYDPVFQPDGYGISFAEMSLEEKNRISHRGTAIKKLADFLKNENI